jgi:hypothetical protein
MLACWASGRTCSGGSSSRFSESMAAAWPVGARAQQSGRLRQIAMWMGRANDAEGLRHAAAFREGLQALGWTDGRNIRTDYRWVTGDIDRGRLAKEVVEQKPDLIVAETTVAVAALARQGSPIPIIFVNVSDPVGGGFVGSLAKPGGTITGFMSNEPTLGGKWPELLKEIAPGIRRIGLLFNPNTAPYAEPFLRSTRSGMRPRTPIASFGARDWLVWLLIWRGTRPLRCHSGALAQRANPESRRIR